MRQLLDYMAKAEDRYVADIIKRAIKQYAQKWHSHKLYDYENAIKENLTPAQAIARAKADMREISHQLNKAKRLMTIHNIDMDSEE
jgi:cbb3-type cytochrome oxidase cytochrome c subunit